jgi:fibronectin-binding autotransporter adhesin
MCMNKYTGRKMSAFKLLALTSTALVGLALPSAVLAQDWTGGGDWFDPANWTPAHIPTAGDDVTIDDSTAGTPQIVGLGQDAQASQIIVGDSQTITLNIWDGGTLTSGRGIIGNLAGSHGLVDVGGGPSLSASAWNNGGSLIVGNFGDGVLGINLGTVSNTIGMIGANVGSTGVVAVGGANAVWTNSGRLTIGGAGNGALNVLSGGSVSNKDPGTIGDAAGSTGAVLVSGAGSNWDSGIVFVGGSGDGVLNILSGGAVNDVDGYLGLDAGSTGVATVDGAGSTWTNTASLYIGYSGSGALHITDGGVVHAGFTGLSSSLGITGVMTVDGADSAFVGSGNLTIGSLGSGLLTITGGGVVSNLDGTIGAVAGSDGTVTVDGAGSTWTSGFLRVGDSGDGVLNITNGGVVHDVAGIIAATDDASTGHVTVDGADSVWFNEGGTLIGINGAARLDIRNGGQVITGATVAGAGGIIGSAADSSGFAAVEGAGSTWTVGADLLVGFNGDGILAIDQGGVVTVGGALILAQNAGSKGDLNIGASIAAGTLNAASVQFGAGVGRINFDHTSAGYSFDVAINGFGTVNQWGGVTHLTADSSGFGGVTHVTGGSLLVDGKLGAGAVDVQSGGILGGMGMIGGAVSIASGGTLSGLQGQTLTMQGLDLADGANIDVTLGMPGGAALFGVVNDLTLDGTLRITSGAGFGPGVYSLMTYGGSLTDNGLDIGATPAGTSTGDFAVQTSVAGQVNLIADAMPDLTFWDGDAAGSAGNNAVDGGSGVWSATSANWTDFAGAANGAMHPQPGFAIFQGTAGTVTADAGAGAIAVTGMQFASDGYQVAGAPITLADANSIIRVGDGSAAGADFTATIGSVLTGSGGLDKTDLGTLILTADNDYAGGTTITDGTLQLGDGGTSGSVAGDIVDNGVLVFNRSDVTAFAGAISGGGAIEQNGAGAINLTGDSSGFTGTIAVENGGLGVISGGRLNALDVYVARAAGSTGALAVDGLGSSLTSTDNLVIGARGDGVLTVSGGAKVSDGQGAVGLLAGSTGMATVDGVGSTWANTGNLWIGQAGDGRLTISSGGVVNANAGYLGFEADATGAATIDGAGSAWHSVLGIVVGGGGAGSMQITHGGLVDGGEGLVGVSAGSSGAVTVDGADSAWTNTADLTIGAGGAGTLAVTDGGAVGNAAGHLGREVGSTGMATVAGAGSTWTNTGSLWVGQAGGGWLDISGGGVVSDNAGYLGFDSTATGTATIDGAGSIWRNTLGVVVGVSGAGSMQITHGGLVDGAEGVVGASAGASGAITVDGAGSAWTNTGNLTIGSNGSGTLAITNGGSVSNAIGYLGLAVGSSGAAIVDGAGSTWTNTDLAVGGYGAGTLMITNGGAVHDDLGVVASLAGVAGTVTVDGAGSVWTNTGLVIVGQFGDGKLTIANGGMVSVDGAFVLAGNAGSTGVLNIGGAEGSAAVGAGALDAASLQFGDGGGVVNFNHTGTNYLFAADMAGAGAINQFAGNTNLTGSSNGFIGAVSVIGGRLAVNGSLAGGQVTVGGGATLGGNGLIGSLTAQSGAIIAPGNSIGVLNVAGNASFAAGSIYQVELTSTGQSDLINVAGAATITNGAQLSVVKTDAAPYVLGAHYNVLTAADGVSGAFTFNTVQLTNFIGLVGGSNATSVYLDVAKTKTFASAGATDNETAVGAALDALPLTGGLVGAVANLPTDASARDAFNQLSGEIHASARGVMIEDSRFVRDAAMDRLRDQVVAGGPAVWGRGYGAWGRMDGDGNAATVKHDIGGFLIGADGMVGEAWRVGVIGGYSQSTFQDDARKSSGTSDNYEVGAYAGARWGAIAFRSGLAYSWHELSTNRSVSFPGFADALKGDYQAGAAQAFGELAYGFESGRVAFEPFASVAYVSLRTDGFDEKGGAAALTGKGDAAAVTFTTLGSRAASSFTLGNGWTVTARGTLGWRHAFGDTATQAAMAFPGGSSFDIGGAPIAENAAVADLGLDVDISENAAFGFSYGGQFGSGSTDQSVQANFVVRF